MFVCGIIKVILRAKWFEGLIEECEKSYVEIVRNLSVNF